MKVLVSSQVPGRKKFQNYSPDCSHLYLRNASFLRLSPTAQKRLAEEFFSDFLCIFGKTVAWRTRADMELRQPFVASTSMNMQVGTRPHSNSAPASPNLKNYVFSAQQYSGVSFNRFYASRRPRFMTLQYTFE